MTQKPKTNEEWIKEFSDNFFAATRGYNDKRREKILFALQSKDEEWKKKIRTLSGFLHSLLKSAEVRNF